MSMPATLPPQPQEASPARPRHAAHGHSTGRWSALASDAGGRLVRVGIAVAVLWLAVGWALAAGVE